MGEPTIPTLFEWLGGQATLDRLTARFYRRLEDDPEFRSAIAGYLEWGSRLAVIDSASDENAVEPGAPMPKWGWGEVKGPYLG